MSDPSVSSNERVALLERIARLATELCVSVDKAAEDIGGERPALEILRDIGPLTDQLEKLGPEPAAGVGVIDLAGSPICKRCNGSGIVRDLDTSMGGQCPDCSVETTGWRPMEALSPTVEPPTFVLIAERKPDDSYVVGEARWFGDQGWRWAGNDPTDHWGREVYPERWMPLPAPPSPVKAAEPRIIGVDLGSPDGDSTVYQCEHGISDAPCVTCFALKTGEQP